VVKIKIAQSLPIINIVVFMIILEYPVLHNWTYL